MNCQTKSGRKNILPRFADHSASSAHNEERSQEISRGSAQTEETHLPDG